MLSTTASVTKFIIATKLRSTPTTNSWFPSVAIVVGSYPNGVNESASDADQSITCIPFAAK